MTVRLLWLMLVFTLFLPRIVICSMQQRVQDLLQSRNYLPGNGIGVVIRDLESDSIVVSINADSMMNPASVSKLVTGTSALELLGPTFTYSTKVFIEGAFNADSGVVEGNLCIKGQGDPGFSTERLWLFVQHLKHRGLKKITGDLILDDYYFDTVSMGPGFSEDDGSRTYQSLVNALCVNFSSVAIHQRTGRSIGAPVHIDVFPRIEGIRINSSAVTVAPGTRDNLDVTTSFDRGTTQINVRGGMPLNGPSRYTYRKVWQTWETFGGAVQAQFADNGMRLSGKILHRKISDSLISKGEFYSFESEPLTEFIDHMFKWSSNFTAEMLFKTMAAQKSGQGTWQGGAEVVQKWWESRNLPGKPVIVNGSGMGANTNRCSSRQIADLLAYVYKQKSYFPDFLSSLSVAGIDGTLKVRFYRSRLRGVVRAKTGTLNSAGVSSLAGYVLLPQKTYSFAIICNKVGQGQYDNWVIQEQILEQLVSAIRWKE